MQDQDISRAHIKSMGAGRPIAHFRTFLVGLLSPRADHFLVWLTGSPSWTSSKLLSSPYKKIHQWDDWVFIWYKRHPQVSSIRESALAQGLLVVMNTDAASEIGWGACVGNHWVQGTWSSADTAKHINWKELKAYSLALDQLAPHLTGKLVYVKVDNVPFTTSTMAEAGSPSWPPWQNPSD